MSPHTMRRLRQWHQYLGMFFAPAILFFALSGGLQVIELHESHDPAVKPAPWIVWMSDIHKHSQVIDRSKIKPRPPLPMPPAGARPAMPERREEHFQLFKPFALALALVLFGTTLLGMTIALSSRVTRRPSLIALALGVVVPVVLILA